jgi:hypothetical protein
MRCDLTSAHHNRVRQGTGGYFSLQGLEQINEEPLVGKGLVISSKDRQPPLHSFGVTDTNPKKDRIHKRLRAQMN